MTGRALATAALGSFLGILPGGGAALASFGAYALEKKVSRHRDERGKGAIKGVAGPEAANNAGAQMSFIVMLTLGIPSNPAMALMIASMRISAVMLGFAAVLLAIVLLPVFAKTRRQAFLEEA